MEYATNRIRAVTYHMICNNTGINVYKKSVFRGTSCVCIHHSESTPVMSHSQSHMSGSSHSLVAECSQNMQENFSHWKWKKQTSKNTLEYNRAVKAREQEIPAAVMCDPKVNKWFHHASLEHSWVTFNITARAVSGWKLLTCYTVEKQEVKKLDPSWNKPGRIFFPYMTELCRLLKHYEVVLDIKLECKHL